MMIDKIAFVAQHQTLCEISQTLTGELDALT